MKKKLLIGNNRTQNCINMLFLLKFHFNIFQKIGSAVLKPQNYRKLENDK